MHPRNFVLTATLLCVTGPLTALDLTFPVNFPKFTGMDATITVNGQPVNITVRVAPDEKGKYGCVTGGCTVDGNEVIATGKLSPKPNPAGGFFYFFKGSLKSPKGTSKETKVKVSISGEITTGTATFKYKGPAGKDTLTDHPANILADLNFSLGSVSIDPELLTPGKFGGSGTITTGLGNDTIENGPLKMTLSPCKLVISLKVGKKKFIFKGQYEDGVWVGSLTVVAKPFKTKTELSVPAEGPLDPPVPCGFEIPKPGSCPESIDEGFNGPTFMTLTLFDSTGTLPYGGGSFVDSPRGNVFAGFTLFLPDEGKDYYAEEGCLELDRMPTTPGPWVCLTYDVGYGNIIAQDFNSLGSFCLDLESTSPFLDGQWYFTNKSGSEVLRGYWRADAPVCGFQSGEVLLGGNLAGAAPFVQGQFNLYSTSIGGVSGEMQIQIDDVLWWGRGECLEVDTMQSSPGDFFSMSLYSEDFLGMEVAEGRIDFSLVTPGELPEGTWEVFDLSNVSLLAGTWKTDPRVVCGFEEELVFGGEMTNGGYFGNFSVWDTSKDRQHADFWLGGLEASYFGEAGCLDLDETATGLVLTIPASTYDNDTGAEIDAGRIDLSVTTPLPFANGDWTLYDLAGGEIASGAWDFDQFIACGNQHTFEPPIDLKDDQDNFIGNLNLGMTTKGYEYVNLNLFTDGKSYTVNNQCLDFEVGKADTGVWFTADLDGFDSESGAQIQVGTITFEIDAVTPAREGIWSARDLGGSQFAAGRWAEPVNE